MATFTDFNNEWRGEIANLQGNEPPDGGIVLKNITHQHYNFAKDVRVIGFWITFEKLEKSGTSLESHFYIIDRTNFDFNKIEQLSGLELNNPSSRGPGAFIPQPSSRENFLDSITRFHYFKYVFGIRTVYSSKNSFMPANCEAEQLVINQSYLFTRYSASPAHEPTSTLQAARFYPQIHTDFTPNKNFQASFFPQYKIKSIRFDYRFHLNLDSFVRTPSPLPVNITSLNFAGIFKDHPLVTARSSIARNVARASFEAAEKPLVLEITAKGYENGSMTLLNKSTGWDNIHWWGMRYKWEISSGSQPELVHISTIGGFFAAHFHWHWGEGARIPIPFAAPAGGDGQFHGTITTNSPIIDGYIPNQTLSFAIVKYSPTNDPNLVTSGLSRPKFFDLFSLAKPPADISKGENLVMWVCIDINRNVDNIYAFSGSQLIHGIFFAHNPEPGFLSLTGSTDAIYFPNDFDLIKRQKQWERY